MFVRIASIGSLRTSLFVLTVALLGSPAIAQRTARPADANLGTVRALLLTAEADIDLAKAKLTIDRMIDPSIDVAGTLAQLDAMAKGIRSMLPASASNRLTLDALRFHMYQSSPWNGNRPFRYDLDDPFGANVRNKLLPIYMTTRKGNCVSMPLLFIILGQKLGIDVTASRAPNHLFVKYRGDDGTYFNLEATSGAGFTRDVWMRQEFPMTDEALASGIYMRPLSRKETVLVMVGTLMEFYERQGLQQQRIAMARLVLEFDPKDVVAILHAHQAHREHWLQEFANRYPTPNDIPLAKRPRFMELEENLRLLYERAYALGWRPRDQELEDRYRQAITRARSTQ